jgi:hypothetical protein
MTKAAVSAWVSAALFAALAWPSAAEAAATQARSAATCQQLSLSVFLIDGETTEELRDCVRTTLGRQTSEIIVRSGGGNIEMALDIAELLKRPNLTIKVREKCYSSCANYFLPLATTLVIEPGSTIVVHGGIDPLFVRSEHIGRRADLIRDRMRLRPDLPKKQIEQEFDASILHFNKLVERQKAFASEHRVGLGWFLYREPGDTGFGRFLTGEAGAKATPFGWKYLLVEEAMLRSCLPRVNVHPFQQQLEATFINDKARFARFQKMDGRRSLHLRCAGGSPSSGAASPRKQR